MHSSSRVLAVSYNECDASEAHTAVGRSSCLEIPLKQIFAPVHVAHFFGAETALRLAFRHAPRLFRCVYDVFALLGVIPPQEPKKLRTTDPSTTHAFSCPTAELQLVVRSNSDCGQVRDILSSYGLTFITDSIERTPPLPTALLAPWDERVQREMRVSSAPFDVKYGLALLVADGRVHERDVGDVLRELQLAGRDVADAL